MNYLEYSTISKKQTEQTKRVQNLASYLNVDMLRAMHHAQKKGKASGVDGVTKEEYEHKRTYIPKDGKVSLVNR